MNDQKLDWVLLCDVTHFDELSSEQQELLKLLYTDWNQKEHYLPLKLPPQIKNALIEIMISPLKEIWNIWYIDKNSLQQSNSFDTFFKKNLKKIINNLLINHEIQKEVNDENKMELFVRLCNIVVDLKLYEQLMLFIKNTITSKQEKFHSFFVANFLKMVDLSDTNKQIDIWNQFFHKNGCPVDLICPCTFKLLILSLKDICHLLDNEILNRFHQLAKVVKTSDDPVYQCDYLLYFALGQQYFLQNLKCLKRYISIIKEQHLVGIIITNLKIPNHSKTIVNEILFFTYLGYLVDKKSSRNVFSQLLNFFIEFLSQELLVYQSTHKDEFNDKKYEETKCTINSWESDLFNSEEEFLQRLQTDTDFVKTKLTQFFHHLFNQPLTIDERIINQYITFLADFKLPIKRDIKDSLKDTFENLFFTTIYAYDNMCFDNGLWDDVIIQKDFTVKDFNKNLLAKFIPQKVINNIPSFVFYDSIYLSVFSRKKISHFEYQGDLIYNAIIDKLKLDCEIIDKVNYYQSSFQVLISHGLNLDLLIQKSPLHLYNKDIYSQADYFEIIVYYYYLEMGFEETELWILNLIKNEAPQCLISLEAKSKAITHQQKHNYEHNLWYYYKNKSLTFNATLAKEEVKIKNTYFDRLVKMWIVETQYQEKGINLLRKDNNMKKIITNKISLPSTVSKNAQYDKIVQTIKQDKTYQEICNQIIEYKGNHEYTYLVISKLLRNINNY